MTALVVVAVLVVLGVDALSQVGRASAPVRRTENRSFAALALPVVDQSNATGAALEYLWTKGPSLDRVTFFSDLATMASDSAAEDQAFVALTPPTPSGDVLGRCQATMSGRREAAARLQSDLDRLLGGRDGFGGGDEAAAVGGLVSIGDQLRVADASWAGCRRALLHQPGSARLAGSTWVHDPTAWSETAVSQQVASLVSSPTLAPVHRLTLLSVSTTPAAVPAVDGVGVVAPSTALAVRVVVADVGNVGEARVNLVVTAVPQGTSGPQGTSVPQGTSGGPDLVRATTGLAPGQSVVLSPPSLKVSPGRSYVLTVTATPATGPGRASTSIPLRVSAPPPTTTTTTTTAPARRR